MVRIILPLAVIAVLMYAPIYVGEPTMEAGIEEASERTGSSYVKNTVGCWIGGDPSIDGKCKPAGDDLGLAIFGAIFMSAAAAVLGVLGLLPFVGRLTSLVTIAAGITVVAAMGYYVLQAGVQSTDNIGWGSYLAGGGGLLTLISGLSGLRGR